MTQYALPGIALATASPTLSPEGQILLAQVSAALADGRLERSVVNPEPARVVTIGLRRPGEIKLETSIRSRTQQMGYDKRVVQLSDLRPAELRALAQHAGISMAA